MLKVLKDVKRCCNNNSKHEQVIKKVSRFQHYNENFAIIKDVLTPEEALQVLEYFDLSEIEYTPIFEFNQTEEEQEKSREDARRLVKTSHPAIYNIH